MRPSMISLPVLSWLWRPLVNSCFVLNWPQRPLMNFCPALGRPMVPSQNSRPVLNQPWRMILICLSVWMLILNSLSYPFLSICLIMNCKSAQYQPMNTFLSCLSVPFAVMAKCSVLNQWSFQPNFIIHYSGHYSKLFKTCSCCGHRVVLKLNNTFQSAVIHYSCWFHIWFYYWSLVLIYLNVTTFYCFCNFANKRS